jgi:four helix bundle protein
MAEGLLGLRIYQLAEGLADEIWNEVVGWKSFARDTVGRQLVQASDSIGGNIAEGYGRFHYKDNRQFRFYARGPLEETGHWLRRALRRKRMSEARYTDLMGKIADLAPQLNAYIRTLERKGKVERVRRQDS